MYTESEASRKWCPRRTTEGATCLGSGCMAWRWMDRECGRFVAVPGLLEEVEPAGRPAEVPAHWEYVGPVRERNGVKRYGGWREPAEEARMRRRGYCGMAATGGDGGQGWA